MIDLTPFILQPPTCPCGVLGYKSKCAYHGDVPYMTCETCNNGGHTCPGCGDYTSHALKVCVGCTADLMSSAGLGKGITPGLSEVPW